MKYPYNTLIPNFAEMLYHKNNNSLFQNTTKICIEFFSKLKMLPTLASNFEIDSCLKSPILNSFLISNIKKLYFLQKQTINLLISNLQTYFKSLQTSRLAFLTLNMKCQFPNVVTLLLFLITGWIYQWYIYSLTVTFTFIA